MQNLLYGIIGLQVYTIVVLHFFSGGQQECPECVCKSSGGGAGRHRHRAGVDVADAPPVTTERPTYASREGQQERATPAAVKLTSSSRTKAETPRPTPNVPANVSMTVKKSSTNNVKMWLNQQHPYGMGIILGVGRSKFCVELLQEWRNSGGLYLIDPFIHIWRGYEEADNLSDKEHQHVFEDLRNQLAPWEQKHSFVRDFSSSFAVTYKGTPGMPPPALVWIDTNPNYDSTMRDLKDWWPLLGQGGVLAGPQYARDSVKKALHVFAHDVGYKVSQFTDGTWFMEKSPSGRQEL